MDPFSTLGIGRTFDIDLAAVQRTHRELSRALHPDRHAAGGPTERRVALSKAIEVNEAFRTVKDPIYRAEALFRLAGVPVGETHEPRPSPELLMDMIEQRELLAEARSAKDIEAAHALAASVQARADAAEKALSAGFAKAAGEPSVLEGLVPTLGELRFYRRFLDEVSDIEDVLTSSRAAAGG